MAYLDWQDAYLKPQWWTSAIYKYVPSQGYIFQKYDAPQKAKQIDYQGRVMQYWPESRGYVTYLFYWDTLANQWMRYAAGIGPHPAVSGVTVGKIERRNPLPPGRYWQDIFPGRGQSGPWNEWVTAGIQSGAVEVIKHEHFAEDVLREPSPGAIPERDWFLFEVKKPIAWPAVKLGFPTVADDQVASSADTAEVPEGPTPIEEVGDALAKATKPVTEKVEDVAKFALFGVGAVLGIKLLLSMRK